jgi:antitoxin component YwqK of YwqJK toxin-antitoxin module
MKFIDYKSPEKSIINEVFKTIPYMDMWISSIIEGYIYENIIKVDKQGSKEEYNNRYGKKKGEFKKWYPNGQLREQGYYKEGKEEGEYKELYTNGKLWNQSYYKEGKLDGEYKMWYDNGELIVYKIYENDELIYRDN